MGNWKTEIRTSATFYGVSGSSQGGESYRINERLLALAVARATADEGIPYILLTDANIGKDDSHILRNAVRLSQLIIAFDGRNPLLTGPTYLFGGITDETIPIDISGSSEIDFVFTNQASNSMIDTIICRARLVSARVPCLRRRANAERSWRSTRGTATT